jgi:hypothetical protein
MAQGSWSIDEMGFVWVIMLLRSESGATNTSVNSVNR